MSPFKPRRKNILLSELFCQKLPFLKNCWQTSAFSPLPSHPPRSYPRCKYNNPPLFNLTFRFQTLSLLWCHILNPHSIFSSLLISAAKRKNQRKKGREEKKILSCVEFHMPTWQLSAALSALLPLRSRLFSSCSSYHSPPLFIWRTSDNASYYEILLSSAEGRVKKNPVRQTQPCISSAWCRYALEQKASSLVISGGELWRLLRAAVAAAWSTAHLVVTDWGCNMLKQAALGSSDTVCGLCAHPVDLKLKGEAESSVKSSEIIITLHQTHCIKALCCVSSLYHFCWAIHS